VIETKTKLYDEEQKIIKNIRILIQMQKYSNLPLNPNASTSLDKQW
jgi:hypothetical protein